MARILWHGISPYRRTGYGVQCRLFAPLLRDLGHTVAIAQMGAAHPADPDGQFDGIPVIGPASPEYALPRPMDIRAALGGNPDLVLVLKDAWVLPPRQYRMWNTACWCNVDTTEAMGVYDRRFFTESGAHPIAVSRHGYAMMRHAGLKDAAMVPHGIDTAFWTPGGQAEARDLLGLPKGVFLAGLNAQNLGTVSRKAFYEQFSAFASFHGKLTSGTARLLVHSNPDAHKLSGDDKGLNLRRLAEDCGIADAVIFGAHMNMTELQMRSWYRSLDVLLNATMGEGFGVPIVEALACGVPVIATDCTAMTEKVPTGAGWLVSGQKFWNEHHGACWTVPAIGQITARLAHAAARKADPAVCVATAAAYDAERIAREYWKPLIEELVA